MSISYLNTLGGSQPYDIRISIDISTGRLLMVFKKDARPGVMGTILGTILQDFFPSKRTRFLLSVCSLYCLECSKLLVELSQNLDPSMGLSHYLCS